MVIGALGSTTPTSGATTDRAAIAENFDAFLNLLVTQLQNQNPLEPLDSNQFTQQLVQFASVEQEIQANDNLKSLSELLSAQTAMSAVNYLGSTVTAQGASTHLSGGKASWGYTADANAPASTVTIRDSGGNPVFMEEVALARGEGTYVWDGTDNDGQPLPDGRYSITIEGKDADGSSVNVTTGVEGKVEGIDFSSGEPLLIVGGMRIPLAAVTSVSTATAS